MNTHGNKLRLRPRPFRLLGYLLWVGITAASFLMFRSFLLLFFLSFLCLLPLLSIAVGWWIAAAVGGGVFVPMAEPIRRGEEVSPVVEVRNPRLLGTLDVRIDLRIRNAFLEKEDDAGSLTVSLPAVAASWFRKDRKEGRSVLRMPLAVTRLGTYRFEIREVAIQDLFGLVRFEVRTPQLVTSGNTTRVSGGTHTQGFAGWECTAEAPVLPPMAYGKQPDADSIAAGMTEVEESNRRGNDFSEVTDVREYQPGDRIRDIHWKLSARQEEWMVKIRTQMAGMELTAVLHLSADPTATEYIVTYTYQELRTWSEGETDIRLLVYTTATGGFDSYVLATPEDVDIAFREILGVYYLSHVPETGDTENALHGLLLNLYPYLGGYIRFGLTEEGSIGWVPVEGNRT